MPVFRMFIKINSDSLEEYALTSLAGITQEHKSTQYGIWKVTCWRDASAVEFYTGSHGIVPSTHEEGFYYSANDTPIAYNAVNTPLVSIGDGWEWQKNGNHGYTEKLQKTGFVLKHIFSGNCQQICPVKKQL